MLYKKYQLIMFCFFIVSIHAADEASQAASSSSLQPLLFQDCVEMRHMPMHGIPQSYEAVVVWKKFVSEGKLHSGCKSIVGGRNGKFLRSKVRYKYWDAAAGLGFIVGLDNELTASARDQILNIAPEFAELGFHYAAMAALARVIEGLKRERPAATQQLDAIKVDVATFTSGSNVKIVAPERLKRKFIKRSLDITNDMHINIFRNAMSGSQKLITHSVPYLVINQDLLARFVAQEGIGTLVVAPERA